MLSYALRKMEDCQNDILATLLNKPTNLDTKKLRKTDVNHKFICMQGKIRTKNKMFVISASDLSTNKLNALVHNSTRIMIISPCHLIALKQIHFLCGKSA